MYTCFHQISIFSSHFPHFVSVTSDFPKMLHLCEKHLNQNWNNVSERDTHLWRYGLFCYNVIVELLSKLCFVITIVITIFFPKTRFWARVFQTCNNKVDRKCFEMPASVLIWKSIFHTKCLWITANIPDLRWQGRERIDVNICLTLQFLLFCHSKLAVCQ